MEMIKEKRNGRLFGKAVKVTGTGQYCELIRQKFDSRLLYETVGSISRQRF